MLVTHPTEDDLQLRLFRILETNPKISQRELAQQLGVSLGKANYCIAGLVERGLVKVQNFRNSNNKLAYSYLLTPRGIREKSKVTLRYLSKRMREYDMLVEELDRLDLDRR